MKEAWFSFEVDRVKYRGRYRGPEEPTVSCVIVPSGQMGRLDEDGAAGETTLYSRLSVLLTEKNIGVVQFDCPLREDNGEPADEEHVRLRSCCLKQALQTLHPEGPLIYIGMSLGAEVLVHDPPSPALGRVLIGYVLEEPFETREPGGYTHLVYGSEDYIGYGEDLSTIVSIAPEQYAPETARHFEESGFSGTEIHILQGYGHTLEEEEAVDIRAEQYIQQLILDMLK
ncbi:hypothetical protein [Paludifilum halophilum]|uniref:Alpha/beta hydrolase n=1 Tax=Paludifilum halophilum TaxID=1642702 RepID=A0A235B226_9BACL|nr:hypothetical protein [Paludifilum halophilum]OYD06343.1 hypothetical protein CHM34_16650 [Paludifilum halophilum]